MSKFSPNYEFIRVPDGDPSQCDRPGCNLIAVEGSKFCIIHGGSKTAESNAKKELRNYRLSKFHNRISELSNSENIMSLRDEIGILRVIIEEKVNHCSDMTDLLLISVPLTDLLMKAQKLIESAEKFESKMGMLLSKEKVVILAQSLIDIIAKYVENPEVLDAIGEDFYKTISEIS